MTQPTPAPLTDWLQRNDPTTAFTALTSLLPDAAVFVVDADRNIIHWSDGAASALGYTRDEVLGSHCLKGIRCPRCLQGCGIEERGRVDDIPLDCWTKDGVLVRIRKHAVAFYDDAGAFAGGIEVLLPDSDTPTAIDAADAAPADRTTFHGLVSRDPKLIAAFQTLRNVAETDATVLIRGESGTGKELVARAIHTESHRKSGPFVAVNCAALSPSLLESELFGHVRGAFTGAVSDREGIFAQADGGTLFLDEVAELPLDTQAKLLRVLQEQTFTPVGGNRPRRVDVRVVAATHKSLREEVRLGRFREDLMFRLRVVPVFLPPLRERRTDVELLLQHFIAKGNTRGPRKVTRVAPDAMRALLDHRWPGNVRELQNVVEYAFAVSRAPELSVDDLPPEFREVAHTYAPPPPSPSVPAPLDDAARVRDALQRAGGNVGEAAAILGVSRPTFWRWRKRFGL